MHLSCYYFVVMYKWFIAAITILVVTIGGYFLYPPSFKAPSKDPCLKFKDIKNTYCDTAYGFVLQYPESYNAKPNSYVDGEVSFMYGSHEIDVHAETGLNMCYLDLCDRAVKERETYNGVTWDFLGPANYCEGDASGGGCDTKDVFRTKNKNGTIYIQSTSRSDTESILKTFRFI